MRTHLIFGALLGATFCVASSGCAAAGEETPPKLAAPTKKITPEAKQKAKPPTKIAASTRVTSP